MTTEAEFRNGRLAEVVRKLNTLNRFPAGLDPSMPLAKRVRQLQETIAKCDAERQRMFEMARDREAIQSPRLTQVVREYLELRNELVTG